MMKWNNAFIYKLILFKIYWRFPHCNLTPALQTCESHMGIPNKVLCHGGSLRIRKPYKWWSTPFILSPFVLSIAFCFSRVCSTTIKSHETHDYQIIIWRPRNTTYLCRMYCRLWRWQMTWSNGWWIRPKPQKDT